MTNSIFEEKPKMSALQKVLLLNPPGKRVYVRDYYCSKVAKSNYCPHPVDLLMLSGRLSGMCELKVVDAIADPVETADLVQAIDALAPDVIISLIGAVSLEEDRTFLASLARPGRRIAVSGDVVLEDPAGWLQEHELVDAVIMDFTSEEIREYLLKTPTQLNSIVTRAGSVSGERVKISGNREFDLPVPRHDLFSSFRYRFPFVRQRAFATVLTDYGCPFSCTFCNMGGIGYKVRPVENVLDELRLLKGLGRRELFFIDQCFGAQRARALSLCRAMAGERLTFGWVCFSRADLLDDELLDAMQQAGCHTVMLGVETADQAMLNLYHKGCTVTQFREAFRRCRERKMRTVATFILGLPEETLQTARATIAFAMELDPDFVSFNIAVPRAGTALRQKSIEKGLVPAGAMTMDQSGTTIAMPTEHLTQEEVSRIRREAVLAFYGRPSYLWRRLTAVSSIYELWHHLAEGWEMIRNLRKVDVA